MSVVQAVRHKAFSGRMGENAPGLWFPDRRFFTDRRCKTNRSVAWTEKRAFVHVFYEYRI